MTKAVIFDFDGTLAPLSLNFDHMREEIEAIAGRYVSLEEIGELHSLYTLEFIYTIEARLGENRIRFRSEAFEKLSTLEVQAMQGNSPFPYTKDVLAALREKAMKLGVITRNCLKAVKTVFPDLERWVDTIVTRDDTDLVKPNPAHVQAALSKLGVHSYEAVLVGDHPTDIMAGRAAKMRTIGVLSGMLGKSGFDEAGPDHIIQDVRGLLSLL